MYTKDTDLDGIPDQLDLDRTMTEFQIPSKHKANFIAHSAVDINKDGLSDAGTDCPVDSR
jgi:hypothetical protein